MPTPLLSVVAPCFNEEEVLPEFYRRVKAVCENLDKTYEIVLINDGSSDATWPLMVSLAEQDPTVVAVNLSRNHGHQLALTAGLSVCRGELILILDADLQDPPELLPEMLQIREKHGADVVYGQRRRRAGETWFKRKTAEGFYRVLNWLTDVKIPPDTGDFRLVSRRVVDLLQAMPERHRFIRGMVGWIGFRQLPILYDRDPRFAGCTKYPLRRMFRLASDAITAFSVRPLALASMMGILAAGFSLLLFLYALASWWHGGTTAGWTSLMAGITLLSSLQFFLMGIYGEYLGRLYEEIKGRPLFVIERVLREERADEDTRSQDQTLETAGCRNATRPKPAGRTSQ
jgi:polyisoprenyl-phosphate glycosyltransferase